MIPTSGKLYLTSGASLDIKDWSENCAKAVATCFTGATVVGGGATNDPFPAPVARVGNEAGSDIADAADPPVGAEPVDRTDAPEGADPADSPDAPEGAEPPDSTDAPDGADPGEAEFGENNADDGDPWTAPAVCDAGEDGAAAAGLSVGAKVSPAIANTPLSPREAAKPPIEVALPSAITVTPSMM
jgi:hypothetical protein